MVTSRLAGRIPLFLLAFAVMVSITALATGLAVKAGAQTAAPDAQTAAPDAQTAAPDAQTAAPTIRSDLDDYPPGALVTLTGSNWQPGETVNIYVEDDQGKTWNRNVDVTADASGTIRDQFNLPDWFVATYTVRATGTQSGVATTSFTDGNIRFLTTNSETNFEATWTKHTRSNCNSPSSTAPTTGSGQVRHAIGNTLAAGANAGEWIRITAPAEIGNYTFSSWSGPSNFSSTNATLCAPGFGGSGTNDYVANYVPRQTTTVTATALNAHPASGTYGGLVNLSATLTAGGSGVNGKTVGFTLNGNPVCGGTTGVVCPTTNTSGVATLNNVNLRDNAGNINAGTYANGVGASFAGDSTHAASSGTNSLTVNKADQTITFGALANKTFGDADFPVSATASSELPVTFQSLTLTTCTVNGNIVHIVAAGLCTLRASQGGNINYNPAPVVNRQFAINQASQAITFEAPTGKTFGDADFNPGATASSGLAVSYSSSTATVCTINSQTNNLHIESAGTCTVTASQAGNANYNPAESVTRSFTIGKASQTINFATGTPTTKTVDDPDFQVSATASSGLPATFAASPSSTCTVNGNTVSIVGAGTCTITASQAGNDNYQAANASHTIAVSKAEQRTLTVTSPTSGTYGDKLQMSASGGSGTGAVSFTATGTACQIPTSGTDAGKLVITSGTGTCSVTATKAGDGNYQSATSAPQSVAISKAELKIDADNQSVVYGAANPTLTYKFSGFVNGDTSAAGLTGDADCSIANGSDSDVGTYTGAISCAPGTLSSTNYRFATGVKGDVTITRRPIEVTADNKSKTYGETDPALTYNVTSGSLVEGDSFSGSLTRDAGQGTGTYAIRQGTLSASDNYALTFNNGTLTINKAPLTVTADDKSKTYGAANPALTASYSGFVNDDTAESALSGSPSLSTNATQQSPVGSYAITAAQGTLSADNYAFTFRDGTLTVGKAGLTVTANDATKTYGEANPQFAVSYSGFVNGDTANSLGGTLAFSTDANARSPVGTYDVTPSGLTSDNYDITFRDGTLTVTKAPLTVTVKDATKTYGEANPAFEASYSGFVNDDTAESALSGSPSLSTNATQQSPVGSYAITAAQGTLSADNYAFTFKDGTLSVTERPITVTADDKSKTYGENDPALTYSVTSGSLVNGDAFSGSLTRDAGQGAGTYAIRQGTLSADDNYTLTFKDGTLTINRAALTVTADDKTKVYGEANPNFTVSYDGLTNGDSAADLSGQLQFSTKADQSSPVGSYDITPSGLTSSNYDINFVDGALRVTPASLTVTANDATKTYGDPNPNFSVRYEGFVLGQDQSVLGGTLAFDTQANQSSPVGTYDVTPKGLTSSNYDISFVKGTLRIDKATLTVTADDKSKTYGEANPQFTASYSGWKNNDTASVLSGSPALSTNATQNSDVGSYTITAAVGDLSANNYSFTFKDGTLTVNKAPLTVTAKDAAKTYGEANPAFEASYSGFVNGDGPASLGGTLGFNTAATASSPVGSYDVTPRGLTSGNYDIEFVKGTLTVNKADLTVTADNKSKTYGEANPTLTGTLTGVTNGDNITASYSTTATQQSGVGTYDIEPTLDDPNNKLSNYTVTRNNGTLTINKAALTVTADAKSKTYGEANPQFTASYSGFKNDDTAADLGGQLQFSTQANQGSPVGTYAITPSGLTSDNYSITFRDGTLTVNKADLTVTADDKSKTYGEANPQFTASYNGFVNGDDKDDLGGELQFSTNATAASSVGSYDVTLSGLTSGNYDITFVKGTLSVTERPITVTADDKSKTYGENDPALTYSVTSGNLVNGDAFNGSVQRDAGQNVGTYAIRQGTLSLSGNYDLTFKNGALTINKADLTVTADNKSKTYGDANPTFTASYSGFKNGDGTGSLGGQLQFSTNADTGSPVGTYAITPSGLSSNNYAFTFKDGTLSINKAPLTVTTKDASKTYGAANPAFDVTYSGFKLGDGPASLGGTLGFDTTASAASPVGTYDVTPKGLTSNNYTITFVKGTLTITPATLTVTADNKAKTYGDANPTFTASYSGWKNNDTAATALTGAPALSTNATQSSGAGDYVITAAQGTLSAKNYAFTFKDGTLTVNKAPLTVAADNKTKFLNAANPQFTASYSGFKNGESLATSGVTGAPSLTTGANQQSPVGSYTITAAEGTLSAKNYSFTYQPGTLKIIYNWDGFRSPVDNPGAGGTPVFNTAKAGQSIPMKFSLSGNQGLGVIKGTNPSVTSVACPNSTTFDLIEEYAQTTNTGLTYDSSIDQYNYVWKTPSTYAGKCFKFEMVLIDDTSHVAYFKFTK